MLIALYDSHHSLPSWHRPQQPQHIFDPVRDAALKVITRSSRHALAETPMWPVLMGLHALNMPTLAAHMSLLWKQEDGTFGWVKRGWVQITNMPADLGEEGVPLFIDAEGHTLVHSLWGDDNGTYSPYQLLPQDDQDYNPHKHTAEYWQNFFAEQLRLAEAEAVKDLEEAGRLYSIAQARCELLKTRDNFTSLTRA